MKKKNASEMLIAPLGLQLSALVCHNLLALLLLAWPHCIPLLADYDVRAVSHSCNVLYFSEQEVHLVARFATDAISATWTTILARLGETMNAV